MLMNSKLLKPIDLNNQTIWGNVNLQSVDNYIYWSQFHYITSTKIYSAASYTIETDGPLWFKTMSNFFLGYQYGNCIDASSSWNNNEGMYFNSSTDTAGNSYAKLPINDGSTADNRYTIATREWCNTNKTTLYKHLVTFEGNYKIIVYSYESNPFEGGMTIHNFISKSISMFVYNSNENKIETSLLYDVDGALYRLDRGSLNEFIPHWLGVETDIVTKL